MPSGWYKNLWRFMSNPLFKLDITEDYDDIPLLSKKDEYLMSALVEGGFRKVELKALNCVRKFSKQSLWPTSPQLTANASVFKHMPASRAMACVGISCGLKYERRKKCRSHLLIYGKTLSTSISSITVLVLIVDSSLRWNLETGLTKTSRSNGYGDLFPVNQEYTKETKTTGPTIVKISAAFT